MKLWRVWRHPSSSSPVEGSPTSSQVKTNSVLSYNSLPRSHDAATARTRFYEGIRLRVLSVAWFLISLALALFVPVISYIISLTGGLAASFIFLFPGLILLRLLSRPGGQGSHGRCVRVLLLAFACLTIILGTFIFGLSVVYTVMLDAQLI